IRPRSLRDSSIAHRMASEMTTPPDLSSLRIRREEETPSSGPSRGWWWIAAALVALAAVAVWFFVLAPRSAIAVRSATVSATGGGSASSAGITANGYVVARTRASVSAKILGRLATLNVHEGSHLRKGEVIATVEDADYRAALAAAHGAEATVAVQLDQAKRDLTRAEELRKGNLNSTSDLENAQTRVQTLAAQLEGAHGQTELARA